VKKGKKNRAAVQLAELRWASATEEERKKVGERIASVGGRARAKQLSPKRRQEIAKKAAAARWAKKPGEKERP
jgi:hypothetical protein